MKKTLFVWQLAGVVFTGTLGVLLHFLYDLSGQNFIVAVFSAVNESIWEHMKLLFFPMSAFALIENRYIGDKYKSFWCVKLIGIVLGISMIPVLYYTINGMFGRTPDWINIGIFFVVNAFVYFLETLLLKWDNIKCKFNKNEVVILVGIAFVFVIFTFFPLHIPFFEDPITNTYGYLEKK